MDNKRCLVTGGAGFIGSHLAQRLQALGHEVTVLDNFYRGKSDYHEKLCKQFRFIEGSVVDKELIEKVVPSHDIIFHMAAILGVKTTMTRPVELIDTNIQGTRNILEAASRNGCKVIFASTSEVYGKGIPPFSEEGDRIYGSATKLRWSYAVGKALEETLCLGYGEKGLPVTILRYFNIYGPRAKEGPYAGVIPRFIRAALQNQDITVYGDGTQTRCFTYVSDAVEATVRAMTPDANQEILNVGSTNEMSIGELAAVIKRVTGTSSPIVHVPFEQVYPRGFEEIPNRVPDMAKSERILGFQAQVTLENGLRDTVDWYREESGGAGR